jgi:hypothetical protein
VTYMFAKSEIRNQKSEIFCGSWLYRNRFPLSVVMLSAVFLLFWQFRFSESSLAQRVFSVANANDFSWRNRVTAWEGAARMMIDRPFVGFGWGQAETEYGKNYCPLKESAAIEMNDYLMIGISAGVPAMICFLVYIGLSLFGNAEGGNQKVEIQASGTGGTHFPTLAKPSSPRHLPPSAFLAATCRAGAIVLLVGFWVDGGLFKLPTACVFWMLLELGRIGSRSADFRIGEKPSSVPGLAEPEFGVPGKKVAQRNDTPSRSNIWLRWLAGILVAMALIQSTIHLGTPLFPVHNQTLAIARKYLVPPKQQADFAYLAAQPIWQGQRLKVLLDHVELANYNRDLVSWQEDDKIYQNYVLSPVINPSSIIHHPSADFAWRRPLWEEFYPRIRHESSPEDAAKIVVRHLRERVTIATLPNSSYSVPTIWRKQITDMAGFEIICVATLRSVGVPACLDADGHAEFWDGNNWQTASPPTVINR